MRLICVVQLWCLGRWFAFKKLGDVPEVETANNELVGAETMLMA